MFPVRDRLPTRSVPVVNYLLIAANVAVFVWQMALDEAGVPAQTVAEAYGFVPRELVRDPLVESTHIVSAMFLHGGLGHLGGNMLYLWIFGDNVEDAVGHRRYLLFYLLGGVAAALVQMAVDPTSPVPMVGASGAIAAVLGAYMALYPRSPITVVNPVPLFWFAYGLFFDLPAWFVILEFFVLNLLSGVSSLASMRHGAGGVAFFAHIGGFVAGLLLVKPFTLGRTLVTAERWGGWQAPARRPSGRRDPWT